jgi:hypothetical protein
MSKYKFVIYEELDGDLHTDCMLGQDHGDIPEEVTDKQLDPLRVGSQDATMESLLEKARTGSAEVLLEKSLDDSKGQFGSKHRDASTYEGDISKLEEKRIANTNSEKEEYEAASETPKRQRWWEMKTKDGLKIASKKEAQSVDYLNDVDWDMLDNDQDREFPIDDFDDDLGEDFLIDDLDSSDHLGNSEEILTEVTFNKIDAGGTPTSTGVIQVSEPTLYDSSSDVKLEEDLRDLMSVNHPELPFDMSSFDFSKLTDGVISFAIGGRVPSSVSASKIHSFPVTVATKKN